MGFRAHGHDELRRYLYHPHPGLPGAGRGGSDQQALHPGRELGVADVRGHAGQGCHREDLPAHPDQQQALRGEAAGGEREEGAEAAEGAGAEGGPGEGGSSPGEGGG